MILTSGSTAAACRAESRLGELGVLSNTKDCKAWMPIWVGGGPGASHSCEEVPDIGDGRSHGPYTGPIQTCRPGQNWKPVLPTSYRALRLGLLAATCVSAPLALSVITPAVQADLRRGRPPAPGTTPA